MTAPPGAPRPRLESQSAPDGASNFSKKRCNGPAAPQSRHFCSRRESAIRMLLAEAGITLGFIGTLVRSSRTAHSPLANIENQ
jgi:hypothetical protein